MSDPISQLVSNIKNGYLARKSQIVIPYSKFKQAILRVLEEKGFLKKVSLGKEKQKKQIICLLNYKGKEPALEQIKVISKPGLRIYKKAGSVKKVSGGLGVRVLSTSKGVMTEEQAIKNNLGGEVILEVY